MHGGATDWYTATVAPISLFNIILNPTWDHDGWTIERNNNSARLLVSGGSDSATLVASIGPGLFYGTAAKFVFFHKCGTEDDPISDDNDNPDCNTSNSTNNPIHTLNVELTTTKDLLTLKHEREADLEIKHEPTGNINAYRIDIKHKNQGGWHTLDDAKEKKPWEATVAGEFELRGVVKHNNVYYASPKIDVTVQFPNWDQIKSDPDVSNKMHQVWLSTLAYSTTHTNSLREEGFFITLDTAQNKYVIHHRPPGNPVLVTDAMNGASVSITLPNRPSDSIRNPNPLDKPDYAVGWFHTHASMEYVHHYWYRPVGPSESDIAFSTRRPPHLPGFVYDYTGFGGRIYGQPGLGAATEVHNIPPERRPTP